MHAPTEEKENQEKKVFYEEVEKLCECLINNKIIMGNLNSKIGKETEYLPTIGKHSLHEGPNNNGTRLIYLGASLIMVIASTCFEHLNIFT